MGAGEYRALLRSGLKSKGNPQQRVAEAVLEPQGERQGLGAHLGEVEDQAGGGADRWQGEIHVALLAHPTRHGQPPR
jgi:hypothetical protein